METARSGSRYFARDDAPRCLQVYAFASEHADAPIVKNDATWRGDLRELQLRPDPA